MSFKRRLMARACGAAFAASMLSFASAAASAPRWVPAEPRRALADEVTWLVNRARALHGLRELRGNARLRRAADRYASWMESRDVFSHYGSGTPTIRAARSGYGPRGRRWGVGEALAFNRDGDAVAIVRAWLLSHSHRAVVLGARYREIGVGVAGGAPYGADEGGFTLAAEFGLR